MVVVVEHEPSSLFLGQGFTLVERSDALEFDDVATAQTLLERHGSEPSFVVQARGQSAA